MQSYLILALCALVGGFIAGLVLEIAWETTVVIMATSVIATVLLYIWARALGTLTATTFFIALGMYLAATL